jgi:hypothetical protein
MTGRLPRNDAPQLVQAIGAAFRRWIRFYSGVLPLYSSVLISDFSTTTNYFDEVIDEMGRRFGVKYALSEVGRRAKTTQDIFSSGPKHLGPCSTRTSVKGEIFHLLNDPRLRDARREAAHVYGLVKGHAMVVD